MRVRDFIALGLTLTLLAGCASMSRKFTFMRPDVTRKSYTQVAPEYTVRTDKRRSAALEIADRLALAEQRLLSGESAQADEQARAVLKLDPRSADAYTILAVAAAQRGQAAQAGSFHAKAAELAPTRGSVLNNYGTWLCGNGRAAESLAWFDKAIADPAYATPESARANAGACAMDAGQTARGERDLRMVLSRDPSNATALAAMALAEFNGGRYLQARAFSERRLAVGAPTVESLRLASQIEQKLGDNQAATRYLNDIAALFPQGDAQSGETAGNERR